MGIEQWTSLRPKGASSSMGGRMKTCALLTVTVVTVLAMNAQANTPSCVSVEEHELAKRNLFRLNAEIWDLKAKHTATTEDMEDLAEAAEKGKTYQGCPKCPKCPKRNQRHLLDNQECVSPATYKNHLVLLKEIEIAKDKLKKLKSEYNYVRRDFRASKKAYCLCDLCHVTTPEPVAAPVAAPTMPPIPLHPCTGEEISLTTTYLDLEGCDGDMTMGLPSALGLLSELTELYVKDVPLLTGTLPTELGMLTKLTYLDFDELIMTGTIPTEVGALTNLESLDFTGSMFSGTLPTELGMLTKLTYLDFYETQPIVGTIPSELNQLTLMTYVDFEDTKLSAKFLSAPPYELSALTLLETCYDPEGDDPCGDTDSELV